jgi:hypothetical protein
LNLRKRPPISTPPINRKRISGMKNDNHWRRWMRFFF